MQISKIIEIIIKIDLPYKISAANIANAQNFIEIRVKNYAAIFANSQKIFIEIKVENSAAIFANSQKYSQSARVLNSAAIFANF